MPARRARLRNSRHTAPRSSGRPVAVAISGRAGGLFAGPGRYPVGGQVGAFGEVGVDAADRRGGQHHVAGLVALAEDAEQGPVPAGLAELLDGGAGQCGDPDAAVEQQGHDRGGAAGPGRAGVGVGGGL
jgi:hypothetical protein